MDCMKLRPQSAIRQIDSSAFNELIKINKDTKDTHDYVQPNFAYLYLVRDHNFFQIISVYFWKKKKNPIFRQDTGEELRGDVLHMHIWI